LGSKGSNEESNEFKKIVLEDNNSTINFTKKIIKDRYGIDIGNILKDSKLLKRIKTQVRLSKWF
jgi:hypothetical protein